MNLSEELKYLGELLDSKLISQQSVGERLVTLAQRAANLPLFQLNNLIRTYGGGQQIFGCDCQVRGCTYPAFRQRHIDIVKLTGSTERFLPYSHLANMKEVKQKLEGRKKEAEQRATKEYDNALTSIYNRYLEALKKAEEMK